LSFSWLISPSPPPVVDDVGSCFAFLGRPDVDSRDLRGPDIPPHRAGQTDQQQNKDDCRDDLLHIHASLVIGLRRCEVPDIDALLVDVGIRRVDGEVAGSRRVQAGVAEDVAKWTEGR